MIRLRRNRRSLATCLLAATLSAVVSPVWADCGQAPTDPAAVTAQSLLDALLGVNGVPGMGAAVWRDGELAWIGCAGWRDLQARQPVRADTVFRFASVSKAIAATAAAKLAEQGKLDLDAPLRSRLPWLPAAWAPMNLRQVAAHVAGLPHYQAGDEGVGRDGRRYASQREAVGVFAGRALLSAPGSRYHYSSYGYTLVGAAVEDVAGEPFLDYLGREIVPGLSIGAEQGGRGERESQLYELEGGAAQRVERPRDHSYSWGGGGLAGTPESLARFGGRLMSGQILKPASFAALQQPLRFDDGRPVRERDYRLGLGWRLGTDLDGARIVHHAGITEGARAALVLWPQRAIAASVASNAEWVSSIESTAMMLAAPFQPPPAGLPAAACPLAQRRYGGRLGEQALAGAIRFRLERGRCVGELEADAVLRAHFAKASAWTQPRLQAIALDAGGGLARAALVTPFGLYDLRAQSDGRYLAQLSGDKVLELRL